MRLASFLIVTHAKDHHKFQTSGRIGREGFLQLVHYFARLHLISELNKSMKVYMPDRKQCSRYGCFKANVCADTPSSVTLSFV